MSTFRHFQKMYEYQNLHVNHDLQGSKNNLKNFEVQSRINKNMTTYTKLWWGTKKEE